ncbi:MAG: Flp pilus assembly protein CpaB [Phycisphaera sp.]|nr:Flp pilus assembly protein CpaB [Phycisphaera sp.]
MRQVTIIVLGLGLAFAAAALVSVLQSGLMGSSSAEAAGSASSSAPVSPSGPDEMLVAVLARDLPAGHRLTPDDLSVDIISADAQVKDVVETPLTVVGQVLTVAGVKGELLRMTNLARPGTGASIAAQLGPGDRAATVTLKDVGSKVILYPGARVDVLATLDVPDGQRQRTTSTGIILEDRRVLAVDDEIAGSGNSGVVIGNDGRRRPVARSITVTLAVRPGEVEKLALASERGSIGLVLRPMEDGRVGSGPMVTPGTIFGNAGWNESRSNSASSSPSPVVSSRPSWWEIVVIRGGEAEQHRFPDEPLGQNN